MDDVSSVINAAQHEGMTVQPKEMREPEEMGERERERKRECVRVPTLETCVCARERES